MQTAITELEIDFQHTRACIRMQSVTYMYYALYKAHNKCMENVSVVCFEK